MGKLVNAAQMTVPGTPGTGAVSLGSATASYLSFADAGCVDGQRYSYALRDTVDFYGAMIVSGWDATNEIDMIEDYIGGLMGV